MNFKTQGEISRYFLFFFFIANLFFYKTLDKHIDVTKLYANPKLEEVPTLHQNAFVNELKIANPNLDDDVAQLMGEISRFRIKVGILQPYLQNETFAELTGIERKFDTFVLASHWSAEYDKASQTVFSSPPSLPALPAFCFLSLMSKFYKFVLASSWSVEYDSHPFPSFPLPL